MYYTCPHQRPQSYSNPAPAWQKEYTINNFGSAPCTCCHTFRVSRAGEEVVALTSLPGMNPDNGVVVVVTRLQPVNRSQDGLHLADSLLVHGYEVTH